MSIFSRIAEQRIREGIERGDFDNLQGMGRPLVLDDDAWVPEDLRMAYRVLKNAGCVPPEIEIRKELVSLQDLIETIDDDRKRLKAIRAFNFNMMKLSELRRRPCTLDAFPEYESRMLDRIATTDR